MDSTTQNEIIDCPYCSEGVKKSAKKCKHCGEIIDSQMRDIEALKKDNASPNVFMNAGGGGGAASGTPSLRSFRHGLHIFVSFITGGLWIPVYAFLYFMRNKSIYY